MRPPGATTSLLKKKDLNAKAGDPCPESRSPAAQKLGHPCDGAEATCSESGAYEFAATPERVRDCPEYLRDGTMSSRKKCEHRKCASRGNKTVQFSVLDQSRFAPRSK